MPVRVLPRPGVTRDDATHLAAHNGWQYHDMFLADGQQPFEKIWLAQDGTASVHWIEDRVIDLDYFAVQGDDPGPVVDAIRAGVPTYDRAQLAGEMEAAEHWDELLRALYRVAAAAPPEYDPQVFDWLARGFGDEHPTVRRMTAVLTSYLGWPELRAPLERLTRDEDVETREVAHRMLQRLPPARA